MAKKTIRDIDISTYAASKLFPEGHCVIGLLVEKELSALDNLLESPEQPVAAILRGVKVADTIGGDRNAARSRTKTADRRGDGL